MSYDVPRNSAVVTAKEMRAAEDEAIAAGTSVDELMRRAGQGAAEWIWRIGGPTPTLILCGPGNNGGDGYVIAEELRLRGVDVRVAEFSDPKSNAAQNARASFGGLIENINEAGPAYQFVDCLFGTGLSRAIDDELFSQLNRLKNASKRSIAIDMPSGVDSDCGTLLNQVTPFDVTISFGAYKMAHFLAPSAAMMGKELLVDIGVDVKSNCTAVEKPRIFRPSENAHKYSRGYAVVVVGEMAGAAILAAKSAQRSGAGYVRLISTVKFSCDDPSLVINSDLSEQEMQQILADARIDAVLIGSGLGRSAASKQLLDIAVKSGQQFILDADALVLLGRDVISQCVAMEHMPVLTPHKGEFEAMVQADSDVMTAQNKVDRTKVLAKQANALVLNKGSDTVIAHPSGQSFVSPMASSWLSVAGTGDVLAGICVARLAVTGSATQAACEAQWLHSRAARLAGSSFTAYGLVQSIPFALDECL